MTIFPLETYQYTIITADQQTQLLTEQEWYGKTAVEMASGEMLDVLSEYENGCNEG